ncbi:MAG: hypothetical protein QOG43_2456 [Actinomycetota bacterium]|jgi:hypothetical protein|nr:hypothetical protein [Actinomycetota bacterium]
MDDHDVLGRIAALVEKEHKLEEMHVGEGLDPDRAHELRQLEVALDQCWDLLRQRRARRAAGLDPDDAEVRGEGTVEGYRQ